MVAPHMYFSDSDVYIPKPTLQVTDDYPAYEVKIGIDIVLPFNNEFTLLWFKDGVFVCEWILFGRQIFKILREGSTDQTKLGDW